MSEARPPRGKFITLEGGEGTGKSTQVRLLSEFLKARGFDVVVTREPGGSPGAEAIRALIVEGDPGRWDGLSETLLFAAARHDHVERTIRPALARGAWVVCDRFFDSTAAYQGYAGGVDLALIDQLKDVATAGVVPDLTIILDLPVEAGLARAARRAGGEDRFERKGREFHEKLRNGFLTIARNEPMRCAVVNAEEAPETVARRIGEIVSERLKLSSP